MSPNTPIYEFELSPITGREQAVLSEALRVLMAKAHAQYKQSGDRYHRIQLETAQLLLQRLLGSAKKSIVMCSHIGMPTHGFGPAVLQEPLF